MATSHWLKLLESAQTSIRDLNLTGLADANVLIQPMAWEVADVVTSLPAVVLSPLIDATPNEGTNVSDDISYLILVAIMASKAAIRDSASSSWDIWDRALVWREEIIDQFINYRMLGPSPGNEVLSDITTIQPNPVVEVPAWFADEAYLSTFAIVAKKRKERRAA